MPNAETNLGTLSSLLNCNLEIHFNIGELDFQPSREGLSYIPFTINAIKKKLTKLNAQLLTHIKMHADAIPNVWDRALYLRDKASDYLWKSAVASYVTSTNFEYLDPRAYGSRQLKTWTLVEEEIAKQFNIKLSGFTNTKYETTCNKIKTTRDYHATDNRAYFSMQIDGHKLFVKNDTKIGGTNRVMNYFRANQAIAHGNRAKTTVIVMQAFDSKIPAKFDEFLDSIANPPNVTEISAFPATIRAKSATKEKADVSIVKLDWSGGRRSVSWQIAGTLEYVNNDDVTFYYVPLSGYNMISAYGFDGGHELRDALRESGMPSLKHIKIYGVRKADIDTVKEMKNWINLESHIVKTLKKLPEKDLYSIAISELDGENYFAYNEYVVSRISNKASPFLALMTKIKNADRDYHGYAEGQLNNLIRIYGTSATTETINKCKSEVKDVYSRYPLLGKLRNIYDYDAIAEYINLIDAAKPV